MEWTKYQDFGKISKFCTVSNLWGLYQDYGIGNIFF